ncbi:2-dehydropantoate 2-reductase protein [Pyrenophora tritici-repentis]|nr:2-dehydropantoate 2-reductase protein [Pyrenophora tritici-repentis]KAF7448945.1 2-dehydropantoate 2-reductase protein [Pyrenophora tritici-repentis]KAI0580319.1 2-dehydropantoate 2-reductase protein [Pyrenophora tritici-repentis]KAI0608672.1 2-dehydropantoate 2-reductase protein [Pyrenophora tritici-repentis]KAI0620598.1 2-dehydropantoate 2-reductase protein [Pyrenophora tritici-repentis]
MAPAVPRLRILSVGGNAVSAFLSWRLQATNACDVTLVWKSGYESVAQYGISFKSQLYGNERFKPHAVVRTPEDAAHSSKQPFDYVLLCVKALPDVYDIANIIESVVSPQHTCILMNTTHSLGVESYLEQRFPTNVVLSLVSGAEISQLGASEFEHKGATDIWVGPANKNANIPAQIQSDMAQALSMTLSSGQVNCQVSHNIRQQQYERMIGPIAFHPASVVFETPNHAELIEKVGVRPLINGVLDEMLALAKASDCTFPDNFRETTFQEMMRPQENNSTMYMDFEAKRPMEIETYLGSPLKLAQEAGVAVPRIETLYATLHHLNIVNRTRPAVPTVPSTQSPQNGMQPPPRMSSAPMPRGPPGPMMNGNGPIKGGPRPGSRAPSVNGVPPMMRRGPPPGPNGYPPRMNGNGQRRPSFGEDSGNLEEFSHLMLYDDMVPEGAINGGPYESAANSSNNLSIRERELMLRQRELQLREQEMNMRRGPPGPPGPGGPMGPMGPGPMGRGRGRPPPSNAAPSAKQIRQNPDGGFNPMQSRAPRNPFSRPGANKNRSSARLMADVPGLHDSIMNNPLMGYSSDRYGAVDRGAMGAQSRTNSLTSARLDELSGGGYGAYPAPVANVRRMSQSPGNPLSPGPRPMGRPSPPNGYAPNGNGMPPQNGRPSPPGMRQPAPRHPPGMGNAVAPQQVEQHAGVSNLYPPKSRTQVRSLTGSASNSSGNLDSENSAHSSQSSLGPRAAVGVQ